MNFSVVKTFGSKIYMKLRKISPELALAGGIACGVGAIVAGCLASRHVDDIINDAKNDLDSIQAIAENDQVLREASFTVYKTAAWELTRLYAPTVALGIASMGLILASHGILSKRYVGLSAAYTTLDGAFKDYRKRVAESLGEDAEKILAASGHTEKNIKLENEEGKVETKKTNSIVIPDHKNSPYEFDYNRFTATSWQANADYNEMYLRNTQSYFNDLLQFRGHVFLNEVLDQLGIARTPAGAVCGWVKGAGDDYIDFGYWDTFKHDYSIDSDLCVKNIHLDFNCDGSIWDMI